MHFCNIHELHNNHTYQYLRPGLRRGETDSLVISSFAAVAPVVTEPYTGSAVDTALPESSADSDIIQVAKKPRTASSVQNAPSPLPLVEPLRFEYDNAATRKILDEEKVKTAASFLRDLKASGRADPETIFKKYNYSTFYDIAFFQRLAYDFNIDISTALTKKRTSTKEVLETFISNFLV